MYDYEALRSYLFDVNFILRSVSWSNEMHRFISLLWSFSAEPRGKDQQKYIRSDDPRAANPENLKLQGRHHQHPQ